MNNIKFQIIDPNELPGEWRSTERPSPYFGLTQDKMEESLSFLQNGEEIVINKPSIRVEFNYPLAKEHILELVPCDGNHYFTRATLAKTIALKYQEIYQEEKNTTTLPIESVADRTSSGGNRGCMLMNRAHTDGVWGIWGHDLSDLDLHTVSYHAPEDVYTLGIDS